MTAKTAELLCDPYPKCHIVFPYTNETAVAEAAGMFAAGGLARGEAVVLIASRITGPPLPRAWLRKPSM